MNKNDITQLKDLLDSVRDIEGFPIGKDEDVLALSDPPYYTACPNPYINDFIKEHDKPYDEATDDYHREPFVGDVSEGKNDPIYNAHSYHTKVPHKAIMKYIEHYTKEGDIVFDGFCGTGMTGVAAQLLNRKAVLSDLSPIASFISYNYNNSFKLNEIQNELLNILDEVEMECSWLYETKHIKKQQEALLHSELSKENESLKGKINYTIWSDIFICPYCSKDFVFWNVAVNKGTGNVKKQFLCSNCNAKIQKTDCHRAVIKFFDKIIGKEVIQTKRVPVLINYSFEGKRYHKIPDDEDIGLIEKINQSNIPYWFPTNSMMNVGEKWGDTWRAGVHYGISHVHHFFTNRTLWTLSCFWNKYLKISDIRIKNALLIYFTSIIHRASKLFRWSKNQAGPLSGTLYIASLDYESSVFFLFNNKKKIMKDIYFTNNKFKKDECLVGCQSLLLLRNIPNSKIDFIFTDPPFGDNLMYSELNFLWESWLKVLTDNSSEAIINSSQNKGLKIYSELMSKSFKEYYRVLKPNRWMTVVFHNSRSSVWNAIQEAITKAGFIIAQVSILDKKQGSFKQITSTGAVKNDLVISAYKPSKQFEEQFIKATGANLEIEFVKQFLENLPKQPVIERTEKMLYSKMLAYYIQRGYEIRYDAHTFYKMLAENFIEKDGYWFKQEQLEAYYEYKKKMKLEGISEVQQGAMMLFITDEKSALLWLYNFLQEPKTFSDIHTAYTKLSEISGDLVPDLKELLDNNFIFAAGVYRRPQSDSERQTLSERRERELMREFETLLLEAKGSKKKIKDVRKEAILHGFEVCYKTNRYEDILLLAKRLDNQILENNADINEFVEIAEIKVEGF